MLIGFLNIFPQMKVKTFNTETGLPETTTTVPILFGPIERSSYINSKGETVQRTVQMPLLHFELTNMELDRNRSFAMKSLHVIGARSGVDLDNLMPYPYNFTITMNIYAKYQEQLMQLIEQIVPMFNYHRVYYTKHPIFPEDITMSHWAMITTYPSFTFNYEYSAEDRRDILAVPVTFLIESWMIREAYESYGMIKEVITNFRDYATHAGLSKLRCVADPTIRDLYYTPIVGVTPVIGQLISGTTYNAVIVDTPANGHLVVKFNLEIEVFLVNEALRLGSTAAGTTISCEPYDPFNDADYGWSGYSGVTAYSGYSELHDSGWESGTHYPYSGWYSGTSSWVIYPGYSGYSEFKTDGVSGVL